jgi:rubrerythrin
MPERLLPVLPGIAATSIDEVLALAHALERQAVTRYELFGRCMRQAGHAGLAAVFESLAAEERRHVEGVERLSEDLFSGLPTADVMDWIVPETFSPEDAGAPSQLTMHDVLAIAIRSEERAFSFWAHVAATATSDAVRQQAEAMARQELVHAARLRHERRQAPQALASSYPRSFANSTAVPNAAAVWREARRLEAQAADYLASAGARLLQMGDEESAVMLQTIAENMRLIVPVEMGKQANPDDMELISRSVETAAISGRSGLLFEAAGVADRLVERYAEMLAASPDAAVTAEIEKFATPALKRLEQINARLYAVEPNLRTMARGGDESRRPGH